MLIPRFTLALGLALSCTAIGAAVPLRSLLTANPSTTGQLGYDGGTFLVSHSTGEGRDLLMGVSQQSSTVPGRVNRVYVVAQREYLTPTERGLVNTAVTDVALKCFNLRPERKAAIVAWMNIQNTSVFRQIASDFGPMNLRFSRYLSNTGLHQECQHPFGWRVELPGPESPSPRRP